MRVPHPIGWFCVGVLSIFTMRISLYNIPFVSLTRGPNQRWYLGYNSSLNSFHAWSDTAGPTTSAKRIATLAELRSLCAWYKRNGWTVSRTWPENIEQYAR